jgi:hypothetical protein
MTYSISDLDITCGPGNGRAVAIEPAGDDSAAAWSVERYDEMWQEIGNASVILLRKSMVGDAAAFAVACARMYPGLGVHKTGEHPAVQGSDGVYEPVLFSPSDRLLWHHENSFNWRWPLVVAFACVSPASDGGETTLVDSSLVYAAAPPDLKRDLEEKGIRYRRFCDGRAGRSWQALFGTDNWAEATARASKRHETLSKADDGVWIDSTRPAFLGAGAARIWFNQLLHWHTHALPAEIRTMTEKGLIPRYRDCTFGDGTPIESAFVDEIIRLHDQLEWPVPWQAGDLLFARNDRFAHGRNPYSGKRKHFAQFIGSGTY